ncbi:NAD-glutamate dehydrogenase domain-containing protein [uncultured Kocuria sp.]|uniref:NAD-glutamate dehydrogenase domain-containing protein n=1 Tax=uncultured Kocuria sp. TaxID=259305 RepID=UPI002591A379|nr:NAD-glutamate dehydrogenase domain-containing protein [uncultured Kocuria sp.]MCT1367010.1 NAD-glutamate dehydrogenase [Rothia sp. p3-SID1597]
MAGNEKIDIVAERVHFTFPEERLDAKALSQLAEPGAEHPSALRLVHGTDKGSDEASETQLRLHVYLREAIPLAELLPTLHNLGLHVIDQVPYRVKVDDGAVVHLYDFGVSFPDGVDPDEVLPLLDDALCAALTGRTEAGSANRLVMFEALPWRTVAVLRAYCRYLAQLGTGYSTSFMADTLIHNAAVTRLLVELFEAGHDPEHGENLTKDQRRQEQESIRQRIGEALDDVDGLKEDEFLRTLTDVVSATVRTNAYLGQETIALKLHPREIEAASLPRPAYEIWVYAPRVEGVHLRFGAIARGGLRWSDRRHDFRTEILGLVKAQMTKNSVIIPTGAKGGFFPKNAPGRDEDPDGYQREGEESYRLFIQSLLDVTDNLETNATGEHEVVHPDGVVILDGPDHYLVVAADKGTATFSDFANSISQENGFWLGDAFASGGSVGFDHKDMGITAKGAWESVKRHFASLGVDCQSEPFTAVGIGGMAGDVFGNGMLLSEHTRLVAAFDSRHIFIDPNPDAARSFQERQRLFDLPRPYWTDYDESLISEGGGVFKRTEKSIRVTPQMREALGLDDEITSLSPARMVSAILKAPVDLLYTGGAGTYVKASDERDRDAGDADNDPLRIDASELRVRVVGEGGNLGLTQRARIEAAQRGVLVNTDAVDNSAGVETSDREVNLKILVDRLVEKSHLDPEERAEFIEAQVEEVGHRVLRSNGDQNIVLQAERLGTRPTNSSASRFLHYLEEHAELNRAVEFLPSDEELARRREQGELLTLPELSVMLAYSKIEATQALLDDDFGRDPWLAQILREYFPSAVTERFGDHFESHPLRREIICTRVANEMIDTAGIVFVQRIVEETGASASTVASAFLVVRELFDLPHLRELHRNIPADTDPEAWRAVIQGIQRFTDRAVRWVVRNGLVSPSEEGGDEVIEPAIQRLRPGVDVVDELTDLLSDEAVQELREREEEGSSWGLPKELATSWARFWAVLPLLDVSLVAEATGVKAKEAALVYFAVYERYSMHELLSAVTDLPRVDRWESVLRASLRADVYRAAEMLTEWVVEGLSQAGTSLPEDPESARKALLTWEEDHPAVASGLARVTRDMADDIRKAAEDEAEVNVATISVAVRTLLNPRGDI